MLSKYQQEFYSLMGWFYGYLYEVPIRYDKESLRIYALPKRKWVPWYFGITFVLILWINCVYILITAPFFERKKFTALHFCLFSTGFGAFGAVILAAHGLISENLGQKLGAANDYIQIELLLQKKYEPRLLKPKFGNLDVIFFVLSFGNFIPYGLFLGCLYFDLDGPYWVLEDWGPDPKERDLQTIFLFIGIRTFFLLPGFLETARTITAATPIFLYIIVSSTQTVWILAHRIPNPKSFFKYYMRLSVICNIIDQALMRYFFVVITINYVLMIQSCWILIRGFDRLDIFIYVMFVFLVGAVFFSMIIFMPHITHLAETIDSIPKRKRFQMRMMYLKKPSLTGKISIKKANSIQPLKFSYGDFFPLGASFCRNLMGNMVEDLINFVLLLDFEGNITI